MVKMKTNDEFACYKERRSDSSHPLRDQHKNRTVKEINQHTIATILHMVSFKNAFTNHI